VVPDWNYKNAALHDRLAGFRVIASAREAGGSGMEKIQMVLQDVFGFIPQWLIGLGLVCIAILCALSVHRLLVSLAKRAIGPKRSMAIQILETTSGPIRLAACLAAVAIVTPLAPLNDALSSALTHSFVVASIALIGWISIRAVDLVAAGYLQRYRVEIEENFLARKHVTQVRVFKRVIDTVIVIVAVSTALMTFDSVKQYGVSLFASAGAAGLVVGLAARPLLSNLIAGVQIAITQPIRIEDAVIIENEWGWVEDIASTYVVIRLWDWRRMVVPLAYFIERPFQNWTRDAASLIGSIILHVDYAADVPKIRDRLEGLVRESRLWDSAVVNLQVVDTNSRTMELRALVSARNAPQAWDLRCEIREKLVAFLRTEMPEAMPRDRADVAMLSADRPARSVKAGSV
jgi:small-conductance mechanosensitive channel